MPRKRRRWIALLVVVAVLAGAAWLFVPTRGPVDAAAVDRVQVGMTRPEVEAVLGGGPDAIKGPTANPRTAVWLGTDGSVFVQFGPDGRVVSAEFIHKPTTALDRARVRGQQRFMDAQRAVGWR